MKDLRKIVFQIPSNKFAPSPEEYSAEMEKTISSYGQNSAEAASGYMQLGDAASLQGNHRTPDAMAYYEKALEIHRALDQNSLETAWSFDKLSACKHTLRDYVGAAECLTRAINIWKRAIESGSGDVDESYVNRREETLQMLQRMASHRG